MLLMWNAKYKAGYKGLLRNVFAALLISFLITSTYFCCLAAFHKTLIPGVDFQYYLDAERGYVHVSGVLHNRLEDSVPRQARDHTDL